MSAPHPHTILFARGTLARLTLWPALRLAVHASWGGPASVEKQRWLAGVLVDQFEPFIVPPASTSTSEDAPDDVYVEDLLLQVIVDEFDVVLEDDSAAAVARDIVRLFGAICAGDEAYVRELEAQAERVQGKVPQYERGVGSGSESESGSEWENDDNEGSEQEAAPQLLNHSKPRREEPQVDEDGFTMVKKKGRR